MALFNRDWSNARLEAHAYENMGGTQHYDTESMLQLRAPSMLHSIRMLVQQDMVAA